MLQGKDNKAYYVATFSLSFQLGNYLPVFQNENFVHQCIISVADMNRITDLVIKMINFPLVFILLEPSLDLQMPVNIHSQWMDYWQVGAHQLN